MKQQNQHYIPKFLLKNFVDTDGRVFCFNTQNDNVTKVPPKNAGSRLGFYEFLIRGKIVSFEDEFQKIETRAAPAFRKIVVSGTLVGLTSDERKYVAEFVAAQSFRTEAFRKGLVGVGEKKIGEIFEQLWHSAFIISDRIEKRKWLLMKIEHDEIFYLGDQPVVLQDTKNPAKAQSLGLDIQGIEAYLPLTPKHALYMPCQSTTNEIISGYEAGMQFYQQLQMTELNNQRSSESNTDEILRIQRLLHNPRNFFEAAINGVPLICDQGNVEGVNYLQCAWAHQNVFSNQKHFAFAKHVLNKTPAYRKTMQTRIHEL